MDRNDIKSDQLRSFHMKRIFSSTSRLLLKLIIQFAFGGALYYSIELIFRIIRQHNAPMPHVFFLGGGAFIIGLLLCRIPMPFKIQLFVLPLLGFVVLTVYEYFFGLYFIVTQNLRIWNYTGCSFEYQGLICLKFSLCWGAIMWLILALHHLFEYMLRNTPLSDKKIFGNES